VIDVTHVTTQEDPRVQVALLFDPRHDGEERILKEQFYA